MKESEKKEANLERIGELPRSPLNRTLLQYAEKLLDQLDPDKRTLGFLASRLSPSRKKVLLATILAGYNDAAKRNAAEEHVDRLECDDDLDIGWWIFQCVSSTHNSVTVGALASQLKDLIRQEIAEDMKTPDANILQRVDALKALFRLGEEEKAIILFTLCYQQSHSLERLCDSVCYPRKFYLVSILTGLTLSQVQSSAGRQGRLVRCGVMQSLNLDGPPSFCQLNAEITEYLLGMGDESLIHKYCKRVDAAPYGTDSFSLPAQTIAIMSSLLRSGEPCNILLYGVPGTGKTEFAKAVAVACGKAACFVECIDDGENSDRRPALMASIGAYPSDVLVVDEADSVLNTRYSFVSSGCKGVLRKEWLNDFLDKSAAQIIWITNDITHMEESTLRRFSYSIEFKRYTARQRERIWSEHLRNHPLRDVISPKMVAELSREFHVSAAGVAGALSAVRRIVQPETVGKETVRECLQELISSHERLTGQRHRSKLLPLAQQYDREALNLSVDPEQVVQTLRQFTGEPNGRDRSPVNMLFWGVPGTGKTAFAQHLAQSLGKDLLVKRASDLVSMWVGGTEEKIRDAFEQAEKEESILCLDEADSFFIDRTNATRSWEKSQTNELLTQMENHHGILICCTNLLDSLDHAAMRRFAWKVKFLPLKPEAKVRLYRKYFVETGGKLPAGVRSRIERIPDLTPGDIKAVWLRYRFRPEANRDHAEMIAALEEEVRYKETKARVTGFE